MSSPPRISVVVSTRNRGRMIEPALRSLIALEHDSFEVVVLDQSTDAVTEDLVRRMASEDSRLRYVRSARAGLSRGRNDGVAASNGKLLAFTDDDCIVDPEWLRAIENEMRDPNVGGVFGRVLPNEYTGRTGIDLAFKESRERVEYEGRCIPWHVGHGANMAFKRQALLETGGFDEILGAGGRLPSHEDGDMTYRVLARKWKVVFSPGPLVYHRQWRDWTERKRTERAYGLGAGGQFFKYARLGDPYGLRLLGTWIWQLGIRRVGAGLLKWRSSRVTYLGVVQLFYPWFGVARSLRFPVDAERAVYLFEGSPRPLLGDRLNGRLRNRPPVNPATEPAAEVSHSAEQR